MFTIIQSQQFTCTCLYSLVFLTTCWKEQCMSSFYILKKTIYQLVKAFIYSSLYQFCRKASQGAPQDFSLPLVVLVLNVTSDICSLLVFLQHVPHRISSFRHACKHKGQIIKDSCNPPKGRSSKNYSGHFFTP